MKILLDLDNVLADFEAGFFDKWNELNPGVECPVKHNRTSMYVYDKQSPEYKEKILSIVNAEGYFRDLKPVQGAIEAVDYFLSKDHEVSVVSSPGQFLFAPSEKYLWVKQHFGPDMHKKMVLTRSKYQVKGDILIDDKPEIKNADKAEWEHVIYDRPYNQHIKDKKRLTWANFKEVLEI